MALIPMKQEIVIFHSGGIDDWGNSLPGEKVPYKCRVDEGTFLVEYRSGAGGNVSSREVVAEARILLDKLVDVGYDDVIVYVNELGKEIKRPPKKIDVKRHINGKPLMTEVYI